MAKKVEGRDAALALTGKNIEELRALASRFLADSSPRIESLDRQSLIVLLSRAASMNHGLARELRKSSICIKPSFYLMAVSLKSSGIPSAQKAKEKLNQETRRLNARLQSASETPHTRGFQIWGPLEIADGILKFSLSWERVHWYWSPADVSLDNIYGLRFGYAILNLNAKKAIVICQTLKERDYIVKVISAVYPIQMSPIVLTKPVLNQIGDFTTVKRAHYFVVNADASTPANITYADENLASITLVRTEENDTRSLRKQSLYRIPLAGSLIEQGVGATSDTGKLWIPKETPLESVEAFGVSLLDRVTGVLTEMTESGEYDEVLKSLGVAQLPFIQEIKTTKAREEICSLIGSLVNMLLKKETERPYNVRESLAIDCVPQFFDYPRLLLVDPRTSEIACWTNIEGSSARVCVKRTDGALHLVDQSTKREITLSSITHPLTGRTIEILDPLSHVELVPTKKTCEAVLCAIQHISNHISGLASVIQVPFRLSSNVLLLDVDRSYGRSGPGPEDIVLTAQDVVEFRRPLGVQVTKAQHLTLKGRLAGLGEKCGNMTDDNCRSCVETHQGLCLRSLVGSFLKDPLILAHKGIELSDLQGACTVEGRSLRLYGFFKIGTGRAGLTARNSAGAVLLSQVSGQINKSTFDVALVVSPSTINEDLRERLQTICAVFGKRLLILDGDALGKLLLEYDAQRAFAA